MATAVAAWAAGGAWATLTAEAAVVYVGAYVVTTVAIAYGTSQILQSLADKPKNEQLNSGRDLMLRSAVAPKRVIYGRDKVSGPLVFAQSTNANAADDPYIIEDIYISDTTYNTQSASIGVGALGGVTPYTAADSGLVTWGTPFTVGAGPQQFTESTGVYTFNAADIGTTVRLRYLKNISADLKNYYLFMVVALAAHECDAIEKIYINDEEIDCSTQLDGSGNVTSGKFATITVIERYLGTASQAASALLVAASGGKWTTAHQLKDICYVVIRMEANFNVFPQQPQIKALVRGKKCYDPRTGLTVWTENPAVCIRDFCKSAYGFNATDSRLNDTYFNSAANTCDESVVKPGGGTHTRYVLDGSFTLDVAPPDTLRAMLQSMVGWWTYSGGKICVGAGVYVAPTGPTLTASMLRAPIGFAAKPKRREVFNTVRGRYISADAKYKETDYPPITVSSYVTEDGGQEYAYNLDLPFVQNGERAQRIAKTYLRKSRQGIRVVWPGKISCYEYKIGQTVNVTLSDFGWSSKKFVVIDWQFAFDGGVDLVLQEEDSTAYDWISSDSIVDDPNPDTNLMSPFFVPVIGALTLSSGTGDLILGTDGTILSRIKLSWTANGNAYARGGRIEYWWKFSSSGEWGENAANITGDVSVAYITGVKDGQSYDVRARYVNALGIEGPWTLVRNYTVVGETARPTKPPSFSVAVLADLTRQYTIGAIADVDLKGYQIRVGTNTSEWNSAQVLAGSGSLITETIYESNNPPAGTYNFLVAAFDRTGNVSSATIVQSATLGNQPDVFTEGFGQNLYPNGSFNLPFTGLNASIVFPYMLYDDRSRPPNSVRYFTYCDSSHWVAGRRGMRAYTAVDSKLLCLFKFTPQSPVNVAETDVARFAFPLVGGATYSISTLLAASWCDASVAAYISTTSLATRVAIPGETITQSGGSDMTLVGTISSVESLTGGSIIGNYKQLGMVFTAPSSAAWLQLFLLKGASYTPSSGSYIEAHDLMFSRGHSQQNTISPFVPGVADYARLQTVEIAGNAATDVYQVVAAGAVGGTPGSGNWSMVNSLGAVYCSDPQDFILEASGFAYTYDAGATHYSHGRIVHYYNYPGSSATAVALTEIQLIAYTNNGAGVVNGSPYTMLGYVRTSSGMQNSFEFQQTSYQASSLHCAWATLRLTAAKR